MQNSKEETETDPKKSLLHSTKYPDCWPMVRITWMDAIDGDTGWVPLGKMMNAKLATCIDLGWMIRNDDQRVTIMGSWCADPQETKEEDKEGGRYITIPKGWVKKIEYLERTYGQIRD
jgi:hypothetical protein